MPCANHKDNGTEKAGNAAGKEARLCDIKGSHRGLKSKDRESPLVRRATKPILQSHTGLVRKRRSETGQEKTGNFRLQNGTLNSRIGILPQKCGNIF